MSATYRAFPPYSSAPRSARRLGAGRVRLLTFAIVIGISVLVSAIASIVNPTSQPCGFGCGPRLQSPAATATYTNSAHGFSIDYPPNVLSVASDQADQVEFHSGGGPILFRVVGTSSLDNAVSQARQGLPSSSFQDVVEVGPVRGAEIGYVPGRGTVWSATYVSPDDGTSGPMRVAIIAARARGLTVVAVMFSDYDSDTAHAPYGLSGDAIFDYPVSSFHFPS